MTVLCAHWREKIFNYLKASGQLDSRGQSSVPPSHSGLSPEGLHPQSRGGLGLNDPSCPSAALKITKRQTWGGNPFIHTAQPEVCRWDGSRTCQSETARRVLGTRDVHTIHVGYTAKLQLAP